MTPQPAPAAATVEPCRFSNGWGIRAALGGIEAEQPTPVQVTLTPSAQRRSGYESVSPHAGGFVGTCRMSLDPGVVLVISDEWCASGADIRVDRTVKVNGTSERGFATSAALARPVTYAGWHDAVPFAPGAIYGNGEPVPVRSFGSHTSRRGPLRSVLIREDRLAAPLFAVSFPDKTWLGVLHLDPVATTTTTDGSVEEGGETLVDERFRFASLGGVLHDGRIELGARFPGTEADFTYSCGALPLRQVRRARRRFHPLRDGLKQHYTLLFRGGKNWSTNTQSELWRWAWTLFEPQAELVSTEAVVASCANVLANQVVTRNGRAGVPLDVDTATGTALPHAPAIMGFVGANTDAAAVLIEIGHRATDDLGEHYLTLGRKIIESFTAIELNPPAGEGFDLETGKITTYRKYRQQPAVYLRSLGDGCAAVLDAWRAEASHGIEHPNWLAWARRAGDWLIDSQRNDGSFPRAWAARTGIELDDSPSASYSPIPFLVDLARATGESSYSRAALRAGAFVWLNGGREGCFAGATLDNPNVIDKEAAVLSLEAFLALHQLTGRQTWIERAVLAADVAETWIYIWNVPMPDDADPTTLHWKHGVPTVGLQLIATGVSMTDGFLAVNSAAFAQLAQLTGDEHYLEVAHLVTHGSRAMLALPGRLYDLPSAGWQQEHWCFSLPRGHGLNRNWLPWIPVAHIKGILRLEQLGEPVATQVLEGCARF